MCKWLHKWSFVQTHHDQWYKKMIINPLSMGSHYGQQICHVKEPLGSAFQHWALLHYIVWLLGSHAWQRWSNLAGPLELSFCCVIGHRNCHLWLNLNIWAFLCHSKSCFVYDFIFWSDEDVDLALKQITSEEYGRIIALWRTLLSSCALWRRGEKL